MLKLFNLTHELIHFRSNYHSSIKDTLAAYAIFNELTLSLKILLDSSGQSN